MGGSNLNAISNRTPAIGAWLQLLPDGEYTSVVCGALRLVFNVGQRSVGRFWRLNLENHKAAARMNDIRQKILETLAGLSKTIDLSEDYLQIYRQDEELFRRAEDLYVVLLKGIEAMMDWLDHKTYSKKHICSGLYRC